MTNIPVKPSKQEAVEERIRLFRSWGWREENARRYMELDEQNYQLLLSIKHTNEGREIRQIIGQMIDIMDLQERIERDFNKRG